MLQGHINVGNDFIRFSDMFDERFVDVHRVKVHQANPVDTWHLLQFLQQFCQAAFTIDVAAVVSGVLGDNDQFASTGVGEAAELRGSLRTSA